MIDSYTKYLKELRERNYSVYSSKKAEEEALQELHQNAYNIFDDEEYGLLIQDYYEEFSRLSHVISFTTYQKMAQECDLFVPKYTKEHLPKNQKESNSKNPSNQAEVKGKSQKSLIRFFLRSVPASDIFYSASGLYDVSTGEFILLKNSILALSTSSVFSYTPDGTIRRLIIMKFCDQERDGYRLKKDYVCQSPSKAASFVIGNKVDGWLAWRDNVNSTLKEFLNSRGQNSTKKKDDINDETNSISKGDQISGLISQIDGGATLYSLLDGIEEKH